MRVKSFAPSCRIVAFEPNPFEYETLKKNIECNDIGLIDAENAALSNKDGIVEMEIVPQIGSIGGQTVRIPQRKWLKDEFIRKISVKTITLDNVISKYNLEKIDILKMDVEGLELEILKCCSELHKIIHIVLEYHSEELRQGLIELLEKSWIQGSFRRSQSRRLLRRSIFYQNNLRFMRT
jgi:FkbM family methyltransferase